MSNKVMENESLRLEDIVKLRNTIEMRDKLVLALGKAEERLEKYGGMFERLMMASDRLSDAGEIQEILKEYIV